MPSAPPVWKTENVWSERNVAVKAQHNKQHCALVFVFCIFGTLNKSLLLQIFSLTWEPSMLKDVWLRKLSYVFNFLGCCCSNDMVHIVFWISIKYFSEFEKHPTCFWNCYLSSKKLWQACGSVLCFSSFSSTSLKGQLYQWDGRR